jgi:hypothetical protein
MTTYRAYRVDRHRHIQSAVWLDAPSDSAARAQAIELCGKGEPTIELWQASRLVDEIHCAED